MLSCSRKPKNEDMKVEVRRTVLMSCVFDTVGCNPRDINSVTVAMSSTLLNFLNWKLINPQLILFTC